MIWEDCASAEVEPSGRKRRKTRRRVASEDLRFCGLLNLSWAFNVGAVPGQEILAVAYISIYLYMDSWLL